MKYISFNIFLQILQIITVWQTVNAFSTEDSVEVKKLRHYIRPCLYFNHYNIPARSEKLEYRFAQNNLGFYLPIHSSSNLNKDSSGFSSFHLLGVADFIRYKPKMDFINESFKIGRLSAGVRMFYSDGRKSVFYVAIMPFVSQEFQNYNHKAQGRFTSAFIYSRTVSRKFAYRIGFARTYTFGRALHLPVLGIRVGALDKIHLNIQLPRNISVDFPISTKVSCSVFSRSMGGIYNVKTKDTVLSSVGTLAVLKRFELFNGFQLNVRASDNFAFYVSTGFVTRRNLTFVFQDLDGKNTGQEKTVQKIPNSIFISFGLSVHFGKAKRIHNNSTMYDMFDLNTLNKIGFNENGSSNSDIPVDGTKVKLNPNKNLNYKDVEDLVTDDY